MQPCLQPWSMSLQIFLPFLDHKYHLRFVLDPCGQPSRKSVLTTVQTHLGLNGFTFYKTWRPTMIPQHVVQKERFFLENQVFFNITVFLALSVSHLSFRMAAFASMGRTARALASEHMCTLSTQKPLPSARHLPAVRGLLFPAHLASRPSLPRGQA